MSIDTEIFSKMLASHIKQCVKRITHEQVGSFIAGMCGWFRIERSVSAILSYPNEERSHDHIRCSEEQAHFFTSIKSIYTVPCSWPHAYHGRTACVPLWRGIRPNVYSHHPSRAQSWHLRPVHWGWEMTCRSLREKNLSHFADDMILYIRESQGIYKKLLELVRVQQDLRLKINIRKNLCAENYKMQVEEV